MSAQLELLILRVVALLALLLAVAIGSILVYRHFESPPAPLTEAAAPAVVQSDGSHIIQRQATTPDAKPLNELPKGAKLIRSVSATVKPKSQILTGKTASGQTVTSTVDPDAVTLKLDLDKMADGTERVVASSPDGQVTGAIDIPVAPPAPDPPKWAAGLAYGIPMGGVRAQGVWLERDIWRVRLGVEADHVAAPRENSNLVMVRVGVSF